LLITDLQQFQSIKTRVDSLYTIISVTALVFPGLLGISIRGHVIGIASCQVGGDITILQSVCPASGGDHPDPRRNPY